MASTPTHDSIQRQITLAECCLAKRMGEVMEKERKGLSCDDAYLSIGGGFLIAEAFTNYYPKGEVYLSYKKNCEMSFEGNDFIVNSQIVSDVFYEQYNGTNSPNVASFWEFTDDESGIITNAVGGTTAFTYKWDSDEQTLEISTGGSPIVYSVSYDQFFEQVILTKPNGDVLTLGFYGEPILLNCELVELEASQPCVNPSDIEAVLNKLIAGCPCNCEEYVNVQQADNSGEAILLQDAFLTCIDGESNITIVYAYSGANEENSFVVVADDGSTQTEIYEIPSTGATSGQMTITVTSAELQGLANGVYDIFITDGTTTSNILDGVTKITCES
jgi:hypothetical protein